MLPKLREAKYRHDYCIWLKFADGIEGEVDLKGELWGEIFEPLKEKTLFADFSLDKELQTIVWPNGAPAKVSSEGVRSHIPTIT